MSETYEGCVVCNECYVIYEKVKELVEETPR